MEDDDDDDDDDDEDDNGDEQEEQAKRGLSIATRKGHFYDLLQPCISHLRWLFLRPPAVRKGDLNITTAVLYESDTGPRRGLLGVNA